MACQRCVNVSDSPLLVGWLSLFRNSVEFEFSLTLPDPLSAQANKAIQSSTTTQTISIYSPALPRSFESELKHFSALIFSKYIQSSKLWLLSGIKMREIPLVFHNIFHATLVRFFTLCENKVTFHKKCDRHKVTSFGLLSMLSILSSFGLNEQHDKFFDITKSFPWWVCQLQTTCMPLHALIKCYTLSDSNIFFFWSVLPYLQWLFYKTSNNLRRRVTKDTLKIVLIVSRKSYKTLIPFQSSSLLPQTWIDELASHPRAQSPWNVKVNE